MRFFVNTQDVHVLILKLLLAILNSFKLLLQKEKHHNSLLENTYLKYCFFLSCYHHYLVTSKIILHMCFKLSRLFNEKQLK